MADTDIFKRQNFGNPLGFGRRPALLIVDFVNGFNDEAAFGGGNIAPAIRATVPLLAACRAKGLPIAMTRVVYADDGSDLGVFAEKAPNLRSLVEAAPASQIVAELAPRPGDCIVRKTQPSAFFGTGLGGWLVNHGVDTLIVAGCTTSGCVRASVVDAMSSNLRPIVVRECVGDRATGPHEASLFDMQQKYADVIGMDDAMDKLAAF